MKTAEEILKEKGSNMICVSPGSSIASAVKIMVEEQIGAVIVREGEEIVGIYTERDFLNNSAEDGFNADKVNVGDKMTHKLIYAQHDDPPHILLDIIVGKRIRHLPVQKDGTVIGMLSAGDISRTNLNVIQQELDSASWNYYENWKWKRR